MSNGDFLPLENLREVSKDILAIFSSLDLRFISSFNSDFLDETNHIEFTEKPSNVRSARFLTSIGINNFHCKN